MKQAYNINIQTTDVSFFNQFGINSTRTPDYFHIEGLKVSIIEFTVTASSDFADYKKGSSIDSKYFKEIKELETKGFEVVYYPIIMRLDKNYEDLFMEWKTFGYNLDLSSLHKLYQDLNIELYKKFPEFLSSLNKDFHFIKENPIDNFRFERSQMFKHVSNDKSEIISNYRERIKFLIKSYQPTDKIRLIYNLRSGSMTLDKSKDGVDISSIDDWLANELDMSKIGNFLDIHSKTHFESSEFTVSNIIEPQTNPYLDFDNHDTSNVANELNLLNLLDNNYFHFEEDRSITKSLFNFNEVLEDAIELVENPISNDTMFFNFKNDKGKRMTTLNNLINKISEVNDVSPDSVFKPKSSFTGIFKDVVKKSDNFELDYAMIKNFKGKVSDSCFKILNVISNKGLKTTIDKTAYTLKEMDIYKQKYFYMIEQLNKVKSEWLRTDNCTLIMRGLLKFKDDDSEVALKLKSIRKKINDFKVIHSKVKRILKSNDDYHQFPLPSSLKKEIKEELSRDHNSSGYVGTGKFKKQGILWTEEELFNDFTKLSADLICEKSEEMNFKVQFDGVSKDLPLIKELKEEALLTLSELEHKLSKTPMGSTLEFNSWLFKSIIFLSSIPMKGKNMAVETLGYQKTILFVLGGKSKPSFSRAFKIITPILDSSSSFYNCSGSNSNWRVFKSEGETFLETPWLRYQMGLCEHLHMLKFKFTSFCINMREEAMLNNDLKPFCFPFLAAMNGRRKTEEFLHNSRQILMNFRADYSKVDDLFNKIIIFSKDYFYYFAIHYMLKILKGFTDDLKFFHDSLACVKTENISYWTIFMYCSRLLPKAAVDFNTELRNDIKSFLQTFNDCRINKDTNMNNFEIDWKGNAFGHDLNFNPKLSWLVGVYISDHIKNNGMLPKLYKEITKTYNKNIFSTANNRGCRLHPDDNFKIFDNINDYLSFKGSFGKQKKIFGLKGYEAYLKTFPTLKNEIISEALNSPGSVAANNILNSDKTSLFSMYKNKKINKINFDPVFSIHPKTQWGGSREIFAATVETKIEQQLAENVFKSICKLLPNEMISIPSDRRTVWLHTTVHQRLKDNKNSSIMSYDYRRWGPHSNFIKYKYMILGLADILPASFVEFFLDLCEKMTKKWVIIKKEDLIAIKNHAVILEVLKDNEIKYYEDYIMIKYPHSFVMGIYNYLSSLFHAGSQLLFRHLLMMSNLKKNDKFLDFNAIAHSDDAQGVLTCSTTEMKTFIIKSYESFSKHLNHMQSNKKCQVDKRSGEIISIMRINKKVVTMLAKFSANLTVAPSYKGYIGETKNVISKIIEIITNGGTLKQAYTVGRIMFYYISYHLYYLNKPIYNFPLEALGTPDEYPIFYLLYGSRANLFKLYNFENLNTKKFLSYSMNKLNKLDLNEGVDYLSHTRNLKSELYQEMLGKLNKDTKKLADSDTIILNNFPFDTLSKLQTVARMKDKNFAASMAGGHITGGLSYLLRNNSKFCYSYKDDLMVPWKLRESLLKDIESNLEFENKSNMLDLADEYKNLLSLPTRDHYEQVHTSLKPCSMNVETFIFRGFNQLNYNKLKTYIFEPEYRILLNFNNEEMRLINLFEEITVELSNEEKDLLASTICSNNQKSFYFYASLPTEQRVLRNTQDLVTLLAYNNKRGYRFKRISNYKIPYRLSTDENSMLSQIVFCLRDMLDYIPSHLKKDFFENYKLLLNNKTLSFTDIVTRYSNSLDPYKQVLAYQICMLFNIKRMNKWTNLPLISYSKKQIGSGNVWYGEGVINFLTRSTNANVRLMNNKIIKININSDFLVQDLIYLVDELIAVGFDNPFYVKEISTGSEELCLGFNDYTDLIPIKTTNKMCKYVYPNITVHENQEFGYPRINPIDIRKVKSSKNKDYFLRLVNYYSGSTLGKLLEHPDNMNWCKRNLNIDVPWFAKKDMTFDFKLPVKIHNIKKLGFDYVFYGTINHLAAPKILYNERNYLQGLSGGITDNIFDSHPDYLRTPEKHQLFMKLAQNYPSSFIMDLKQKLENDRSNYIYSFMKGLLTNQNLKTKTSLYIEEVYNVLVRTDGFNPNYVNAHFMIERFKTRLDSDIVCAMLTFLLPLANKVNIGLTNLEILHNCFFTNNETHLFLLIDAIFKIFNSMEISSYKDFAINLGFPWILLPYNPFLLTVFCKEIIIHCLRKRFDDFFEEKLPERPNKLAEKKILIRVHSELYNLKELYIKQSRKPIMNIIHTNSKAVLGNNKIVKFYYNSKEEHIKEARKVGLNELKNLNIDLGIDEMNNEFTVGSLDIMSEKTNKWYYGREHVDECILEEDPNMGLTRETNTGVQIIGISSGRDLVDLTMMTNKLVYYGKTNTRPFYPIQPETLIVAIANDCFHVLASFGGEYDLEVERALILRDKEYLNFCNLMLGKFGKNGKLIIRGVNPKIEQLDDTFIKKLLEKDSEENKIKFMGKELNIDFSAINNTNQFADLEIKKEIHNEYEPLGTFITHKPLEVFFEKAFPTTYLSLMKGEINVTPTTIKTTLRLAKPLELENKRALASILRNLNVKKFLTDEERILESKFVEELQNFMFEEDLDEDFTDFAEEYIMEYENTIDTSQQMMTFKITKQ